MPSSFTLFRQRIVALGTVFPFMERGPKQKGLFEQAEEQLRNQFNVRKIYVVVHEYDNGCPEDSYSCDVGYFHSEKHAREAAVEFAAEGGYSFVDSMQDLDNGGHEVYITTRDIHP